MNARQDVNKMRGVHACLFCGASRLYLDYDDEKRLLGMSEIWIPGKDVIYASPSLIIHYMRDHYYRPPDEYLEAVNRFDLDSDWDAEIVFNDYASSP